MNEVQHNRQVDLPGEFASLKEFVSNVTPEYIELSVPCDLMKKFDWHHPTCQALFNAVEVEDPSSFASLYTPVIIETNQRVRMYYKPELKRQLFPFKYF